MFDSLRSQIDTCPHVTDTHFIRLVRPIGSSVSVSVIVCVVWVGFCLMLCYCLWEFGNVLRLMTTRKHSKGRHTSTTVTTATTATTATRATTILVPNIAEWAIKSVC